MHTIINISSWRERDKHLFRQRERKKEKKKEREKEKKRERKKCHLKHCIALHCIALHCIALHCIALHCIALHCIASQDVCSIQLDLVHTLHQLIALRGPPSLSYPELTTRLKSDQRKHAHSLTYVQC